MARGKKTSAAEERRCTMECPVAEIAVSCCQLAQRFISPGVRAPQETGAQKGNPAEPKKKEVDFYPPSRPEMTVNLWWHPSNKNYLISSFAATSEWRIILTWTGGGQSTHFFRLSTWSKSELQKRRRFSDQNIQWIFYILKWDCFLTYKYCKTLCYLGVSRNKSPVTVRVFIRGREGYIQKKTELKLHLVHSRWVSMLATGIVTQSHLGLPPLCSAVSKWKMWELKEQIYLVFMTTCHRKLRKYSYLASFLKKISLHSRFSVMCGEMDEIKHCHHWEERDGETSGNSCRH